MFLKRTRERLLEQKSSKKSISRTRFVLKSPMVTGNKGWNIKISLQQRKMFKLRKGGGER